MHPQDVDMTNEAAEVIGAERDSPWLVLCDHASNHVPPCVNDGTLGLPDAEMRRHIAWDVGAAGVTRVLADALGAPAVLSRFSRLVIDPNRGEDDPTLVMQLYDGTIVPGNRGLTDAERERRLNAFYRPYHAAVSEVACRRRDTILVAVHSFTPRLNGRPPRPWHVGVLFDPGEGRLSRPLIDHLAAEGDLVVGENEPYRGSLKGDCMYRHGIVPQRPHTLLEIRHDLIETPEDEAAWGARLAPLLEAARADANL